MPAKKQPKRDVGTQMTLLEEAMADLQTRLDAMKQREKGVQRLRLVIDNMPEIQKADLLAIAREMSKVRDPAKRLAGAPSIARTGTGAPRNKNLKPAKGKAGIAIRKARLAANMSTTRLGAMVGGGSGYVSGMESGRVKPTPIKARRLAEALKIPLADLLPGKHTNGAAAH